MIEQLAIAIFGVTAIFLSQDEDKNKQKYACIFGLISQPFWFWTTIKGEQWGMVVLCFFYSYAWYRGFKTHWTPKIRLSYSKSSK